VESNWVHSALRPKMAYYASPGWLWCRNRRNDWQGKPKYTEKYSLSAALSTINPYKLSGREPGPPRWEASEQPPEVRHGLAYNLTGNIKQMTQVHWTITQVPVTFLIGILLSIFLDTCITKLYIFLILLIMERTIIFCLRNPYVVTYQQKLACPFG
jgi:hypothetical protein